jgi:hypothetical protein
MKVFIAAIILIGCSVLVMCVSIIFKKNGKFPDGEISHNKALRKKGIVCAKEEELRLWGHKGKDHPDAACPEGGCETCAFNTIHNPKRT